MMEVLAGLDGVICHMDDVLVFGPTQEAHDCRLRAVLERLAAMGVDPKFREVRLWGFRHRVPWTPHRWRWDMAM